MLMRHGFFRKRGALYDDLGKNKIIFLLNVYFINTFVSPDLRLSLYAQVGRDVAQW